MEQTLVFALCALSFVSGVLSMFFWEGDRDETEQRVGSVK